MNSNLLRICTGLTTTSGIFNDIVKNLIARPTEITIVRFSLPFIAPPRTSTITLNYYLFGQFMINSIFFKTI